MLSISSEKVSTHYAGEKIAKVRWLPEPLLPSERFVTGTWDMATNFVRIWRLQENAYINENVELIPRCNDKVAVEGDVSGMEFINDDLLAVSCSDGCLSLFNTHRAVELDQLQRTTHSDPLHYFNADRKPAPCTGISVYGTDIATIGEDGRLNILNSNNIKQVKRTITADSISLLCVAFVSQQQVFTANRMGIIRMFDARVANDAQQNVYLSAAYQDDKSSNFVSCLTTHPMQNHILLCGTEEGSITVWDLRNMKYPASYLSAHDSAITDIGFHRRDPSKFFTAAEGGELWLWNEQNQRPDIHSQGESFSPWLSGDRVRNLINVSALLSHIGRGINSFDVHGSRLVSGGDSEAICIVNNVA